MFRKQKPTTTTLTVNDSYQGETIEQKIQRIVNNNEPIQDGAPLIYTDRKEGVLAEMDIRTDRFEIALDAHTQIEKSMTAKRKAFHDKLNKDNNPQKDDGKPESAQGTDSK